MNTERARKREVLIDILKQCRVGIACLLLSFAGSAIVFFLYGLPTEPFLYAALLVLALSLLIFLAVAVRCVAKAKEREEMLCSLLTGAALPAGDTLAEKDDRKAILLLQNELKKMQNETMAQRQEEIDYYTVWVHQIKNPIAVMRLTLPKETEHTKVLSAELFRVEQYVDMVLQYIRLGSDSRDLVIREYALDTLIRETIRKFAPQFVSKKLRLSYDGTDRTVVTDKKWFSCILEQLLSNAIKYTPSGSITIREDGDLLQIWDTGIGIAAEDIPRIFEKGFTGENGRVNKRASGLGLYLCKKAADLLQLPLSVTSTVGKGSCFSVRLTGKIK